MSKIDLSTAKAHLRVVHTDEDNLITAWITAAYLAVEGKIFRRVYDAPDDIPALDITGIVADAAINAAVLLIVGHLFENREAVTEGQRVEVPMGAEWLLIPYVDFGAGV